MKRSAIMALLLATMLAVASCGSGGERSGAPDPTGSDTSADTARQNAPHETTQAETGQEEPSEDRATENQQGGTPEQEDPPGLSVTTLQGEEVGIGQGDVTALFFMAGW